MMSPLRRAVCLTILPLSLLVALRAARAAPVDDALVQLARAAGQGEPLFRVGLEPAHRVVVSSRGGFRILDPATGDDAWKPGYTGEVAIVAEGGPTGEVPSVFRIQVGAFGTRQAAEAEKARLEHRFQRPVVLRHIPDRGSWRVRIGESTHRDGLATLMEKVRADGIRGAWIVEEPAQASAGIALRIVDASYDSRATGVTRLVAVPRTGGRIEVDGKPYRGIVELRVSPFGTVRPVNWIEMETYLLGVVPAELGPEVWPQLEALKAQAVAARTYAWRHRGQFEDEGFDLCSTPRCQVYGGASAEHPMSDRAVAETRGEILTWQGEPISALYTATCGGHTEDGGEIFPEEEAPYLTGVPCRAESEALDRLRLTLAGVPTDPLVAEDGRDVTRDWALLTAAGVIDPRRTVRELRRGVRADDLRRWTRALAALAGRPLPSGAPGPVASLGEAAATIVRDLAWSERAELLLHEDDLPALLRDPETATLPEEQRRDLAYLVLAEGLRPHPDGRFHAAQRPSAARLLPALARIGEAYRAFGLARAQVAGRDNTAIRLFRNKGDVSREVSQKTFLFGLSGGKVVPAGTLDLWPGDRVRYRTDGGGRIDFLEMIPPVKGTSDDRSAVLYSWEVRKTRRELEQVVNRRVAVGRLEELRVARRGRSGRVVELQVVGSDATTIVRGFDIRRLLDLRESLAVIEPQRDATGRLQAVVFAGKGWGHGVGLCQVGAYGMALRGSDYRRILGHYYRGARVEPGRSAASAADRPK